MCDNGGTESVYIAFTLHLTHMHLVTDAGPTGSQKTKRKPDKTSKIHAEPATAEVVVILSPNLNRLMCPLVDRNVIILAVAVGNEDSNGIWSCDSHTVKYM